MLSIIDRGSIDVDESIAQSDSSPLCLASVREMIDEDSCGELETDVCNDTLLIANEKTFFSFLSLKENDEKLTSFRHELHHSV